MGKPIKPQEWPRQVRVGHATVKVYRIKQAGEKTGFTHVVTWLTPFGRHRRKIADEAAAMEEARLQASKLNAGRIDSTQMSVNDHEELAALRELAGDVPALSALQEWRQARDISGGNHERVICFVDELDKFCDDGRTWSRSCMTELYGLLERTISAAVVQNIAGGQTARAEVERKLKTRLFLVGAGAWQGLHDRQPSRAIGFGSISGGAPETPLLFRAIKEAGFPSELLGRFHSNPVLLAYPDPDETLQLFRLLGFDALANRTGNMQLLRDFSWSPFGLRSLESLYTDLLLSSRTIETSNN